MFISTDVIVIIWKVLGYLCISWGMGGEGDPFRKRGVPGRFGPSTRESRPVWVIITLMHHMV